MEKYDINKVEKFFKYCQTEFEYGWIDQNGNKHKGVNDGKTYYLQSPEELIKSKIGICWDRTELYRDWFKNTVNLKYETYYLFYEDGKGCPSHSILVFYLNDKIYWFEPMFQAEDNYYSGIHEYEDISSLLLDFKRVWIKESLIIKTIPIDYKDNNIFIYKYDTPKYHINGFEMRNHIDNSELIVISPCKMYHI